MCRLETARSQVDATSKFVIFSHYSDALNTAKCAISSRRTPRAIAGGRRLMCKGRLRRELWGLFFVCGLYSVDVQNLRRELI